LVVKVCCISTFPIFYQNTDFVLEYADPETDGGLEQDLASRRYRALLPEEEYDSDDY
jgi:hypothetical protein